MDCWLATLFVCQLQQDIGVARLTDLAETREILATQFGQVFAVHPVAAMLLPEIQHPSFI